MYAMPIGHTNGFALSRLQNKSLKQNFAISSTDNQQGADRSAAVADQVATVAPHGHTAQAQLAAIDGQKELVAIQNGSS
jgi:triacylglycerol esterase/lipase EstA (alpha/beta hydrolase family)